MYDFLCKGQAHQLCQPYSSFPIAFSIKCCFHQNLCSHLHNDKVTVTSHNILYCFSKKKFKNPILFFIFQMETNQNMVEVKVADLCPMWPIMHNSLFLMFLKFQGELYSYNADNKCIFNEY